MAPILTCSQANEDMPRAPPPPPVWGLATVRFNAVHRQHRLSVQSRAGGRPARTCSSPSRPLMALTRLCMRPPNSASAPRKVRGVTGTRRPRAGRGRAPTTAMGEVGSGDLARAPSPPPPPASPHGTPDSGEAGEAGEAPAATASRAAAVASTLRYTCNTAGARKGDRGRLWGLQHDRWHSLWRSPHAHKRAHAPTPASTHLRQHRGDAVYVRRRTRRGRQRQRR